MIKPMARVRWSWKIFNVQNFSDKRLSLFITFAIKWSKKLDFVDLLLPSNKRHGKKE